MAAKKLIAKPLKESLARELREGIDKIRAEKDKIKKHRVKK